MLRPISYLLQKPSKITYINIAYIQVNKNVVWYGSRSKYASKPKFMIGYPRSYNVTHQVAPILQQLFLTLTFNSLYWAISFYI